MQEIVGFRQEYRRLAVSVDCIGWTRFMEGMLLRELVGLQKCTLVESDLHLTIATWAKELVIQLSEITHGQWLYRNVLVHDRTAGDLVTRCKKEIRRALEDKLEQEEEGLEEDDKFLMEINLDDLGTSSGENQTYWLLTLEAAQDARNLCLSQDSNVDEFH